MKCKFSLVLSILFFLICFTTDSFAQDPNDCEGAIVVCDNSQISYDPIGPGGTDFVNSQTTCGTSEHQSAWYFFGFSNDMPPNSTITFIINPITPTDYDFAIFGPNVMCGDLGISIRCNFSGASSPTGLMNPAGGAFDLPLTVNPGEGYFLLVDNFSSTGIPFDLTWGGDAAPFLDCNIIPGCVVKANAGVDIGVCASGDFQLNGASIDGNGAETFLWYAIPNSAILFLDNILDPLTTGTIPATQTTPVTYVLEIRQDSCVAYDTMQVAITPPEIPVFSFDPILCTSDGVFIFPTTSDDGYNGTWDMPSIDPLTLSGAVIVTFTPNANQSACLTDVSVVIDAEIAIIPDFVIDLDLCQYNSPILLSNTSINGVTGLWNPDIIDPTGMAGMTISTTFTPDLNICAEPVDLEFQIGDQLLPSFTFPLDICPSDTIFDLPMTSDNGYSGTWDIGTIDPSTLPFGLNQIIFTPNPVVGLCLEPSILDLDVGQELIPEFDPVPIFCTLDDPFTLPTITINGYTGLWTVPILDPLNAIAGQLFSTFIPDLGQGVCLAEIDITVNIADELTLMFDDFILCEQDDILSLPTISNNAVPGVWTPASINPNGLANTIIQATFESFENFCATDLIVDVTIDQNFETEFDLPDELCQSYGEFIFPNTSINGINGTWTIPFIQTGTLPNQTIESVFIPFDQTGACIANATHSINIVTAINPVFQQIDPVCISQPGFMMPTISLNDITGTWSIPNVNPADYVNGIVENEFIPDTGQCAIDAIMNIEVVLLPFIDSVISKDPDDCAIDNGRIEILTAANNVEYSSDGGLTWQLSAVFTDMPSGFYELVIRSIRNGLCMNTDTVRLIPPNVPTIEEIVESSPTDCKVPNGSLDVLATGNVLEYSIDGQNWQSNALFDNLAAGNYTVTVRELSSPSCLMISTATLLSPIPIIIDSIQLSQVSDCFETNGSMIVFASGADSINYTINDGSDWLIDTEILNLDSGFYNVIVQNVMAPTCRDTAEVFLVYPEETNILDVQNEDPTDCQGTNGEITVLMNSSVFEYSIDGVSWSTDSIIPNVEAGNYNVIVRQINAPNCLDTAMIELFDPVSPVIDSIFSASPSDCDIDDGVIMVTPGNSAFEYSIDGGNSWQLNQSFRNLDAGIYEVVLRLINAPNCFDEQTIILNNALAPEINRIEKIDIFDCGLANGELNITAVGDQLEFSIDSINWQLESAFSDLAEGNYNVFVREINAPSCVSFGNITIDAPRIPEIISLEIDSIKDCSGLANFVSVNAIGINLEYSLDNGINWQTTNVFNNLPEGNYIIQLRESDAINCITEMTFELVEPNGPEIIQLNLDSLSDCFRSDASFEVVAIGNNLEYSIDGINWQASPVFESLTFGIQRLLLREKEAINCTDELTFEIPNPTCICDELEINTSQNDVSCFGFENGSIQINEIGGTADYQIEWNNSTSDLSLSELSTGWYYLDVSYNYTCVQSDSFLITTPSQIDYDIALFSPDCEFIDNGMLALNNLNGGVGQYTVSLNGSVFQDELFFDDLSSGEYIISVQDDNNCIVEKEIELIAENLVQIQIPTLLKGFANEEIEIIAEFDTMNVDSFIWFFNELKLENDNNKQLIFPLTKGGLIELIVYQGDCFSIEQTEIILEELTYYIPNAFSPNDDLINDQFKIFSRNLNVVDINYDIDIYNRWGDLVYSRKDNIIGESQIGWNGLQGGEACEVGVYTYQLLIKENEKNILKKGEVYLIR